MLKSLLNALRDRALVIWAAIALRLEDWYRGELVHRVEIVSPQQVTIESGTYGKFTAVKIIRFDVRAKSGKVERMVSGYRLDRPWPKSRIVEASSGFLVGDTPSEAANNLHSALTMEKHIDSVD